MNRFTFSLVTLCISLTFLSISMNAASVSSAASQSNKAPATSPSKGQSFIFHPTRHILTPYPKEHEILGLIYEIQPTQYLDANHSSTNETLATHNEPCPITGGAAKMLAAARKLKTTPLHAKK